MKKAVFIDKDGTLIKNVPYNVNPRLVELEKNAGKALKLIKENGFLIIIISNQAGVAKGYFTLKDLDKINKQIQELLSPWNVSINDFYYCPHFFTGEKTEYSIDCNCRKPKPGLLLQAAKGYNISMQNSWMAGDILHDVEAGKLAGCRTILIDNGNETEWLLNKNRTPDYKVTDLMEAAEIIVNQARIKREPYDKYLA